MLPWFISCFKGLLKTFQTLSKIGLLDMILRRAAIAALEKGEPKITLETLKEVTAGYGFAKKTQK
jgi:hypothetical protein